TWVNAGRSGDQSGRVRDRLDAALDSSHADVCVLLIGINDLYWGAGDGGDNPDIVPQASDSARPSVGGNIQGIADRLIARGVRPVLSTVLPVTSTVTAAVT